MQVRHPNAVRDTVDDVDDRVTVGGETLAVSDDGVIECSERQADALAARYGMDVESIAVGDETAESGDSDVCDVVKTDGEVCGRERPCPYHD